MARRAHPGEEVTVNPRFPISVPVYRVETVFTKKTFQAIGVNPEISLPE